MTDEGSSKTGPKDWSQGSIGRVPLQRLARPFGAALHPCHPMLLGWQAVEEVGKVV